MELPSLEEEAAMEGYYPGEYDYDDTWYYPDTDDDTEDDVPWHYPEPGDVPSVPTFTYTDDQLYDRLEAEESEPDVYGREEDT